MKFNFKKISAIASSVLLTGMTLGVAAAAAFPAPFKAAGASGTAVVYGVGSDSMDYTAATDIATYLASQMPSMGAPEGESVLLEKTSEKINLGDGIATAWGTAITKKDLPTVLADGTFTNANNDEYKYTQKVELANLSYTHFADSDYLDNAPTLGKVLDTGTHVLTYTLDFSTDPQADHGTDLTDFESRSITILGKEYFILDFKNSTSSGITLLDSASSKTLGQGESTDLTVNGVTYQVSLDVVTGSGSTAQAKFTVNGVQTNALSAGGSQKVGGAYIGVKSIDAQAYAEGIKQAEFSIGSGKIELVNSNVVKLNEKNLDDVYAYITLGDSSSKRTWQKLVLNWTNEDNKIFLTPGKEIVMPGFEAIKLSMAEPTIDLTEKTTVDAQENKVEIKTTVEDGAVTIPILYKTDSTSGNITGIGKDANNRLATSNTTELIYNATSNGNEGFVVSWANARDAESYYLKATVSHDSTTGVNTTTISSKASGSDVACTDVDPTSSGECVLGNVVLTVNNVQWDTRIINMTVGSGGSFHDLYTAEGLRVYLPFPVVGTNVTTNGALNLGVANATYAEEGNHVGKFYLHFSEEDKNGDLTQKAFRLSLDVAGSSSTKMSVTEISGFGSATGYQTSTDSKLWENYMYSDLATKLTWDRSDSDQYDAELEYHGSEVSANIYLTEAGASSSTTSAGSMVFTDNEDGWKDKNVVLVGGNCVNSATAEVLGISMSDCLNAFTAKTLADSGKYFIGSYADKFSAGKIALVVAGYTKEDTAAAVSYLRANPSKVETTAGSTGVGTTSLTGAYSFVQN